MHWDGSSWTRAADAPAQLAAVLSLPLTHVAVEIEVGDEVEITASAETTAQTGVEMEALVAASVAALTVYDMAKAIDSSMEVAEVRLLEKTKS